MRNQGISGHLQDKDIKHCMQKTVGQISEKGVPDKKCSPVECPALVNDKVHGAHSLLDGSSGVGPMAENKVHVIQLQTLQGCLPETNCKLDQRACTPVCNSNLCTKEWRGLWAIINQKDLCEECIRGY